MLTKELKALNRSCKWRISIPSSPSCLQGCLHSSEGLVAGGQDFGFLRLPILDIFSGRLKSLTCSCVERLIRSHHHWIRMNHTLFAVSVSTLNGGGIMADKGAPRAGSRTKPYQQPLSNFKFLPFVYTRIFNAGELSKEAAFRGIVNACM